MQQPMGPQMQMQNPVNAAAAVAQRKNKKLSKMQMLTAVGLFAVAILAALMLVLMVLGGGTGSLSSAVKEDQYQAVFLDSQDGQVYFGKLESFSDQYYRLTDIFYVRVEQKIQPEGQNSTSQTQQSISLAKLGNELHGPEDEMFIARDKVLFWENLKDDGQVVKAITEYKKNPDAANSSTNSTTNTDTTGTTTTTDTTKKTTP